MQSRAHPARGAGLPIDAKILTEKRLNASPRTIEHATCLGCGCTCDDIRVVVSGDRITEAQGACPLGQRWFGDGAVPGRSLVEGAERPRDEVVGRISERLAAARRVLVYLAPDLSTQAQAEAIAIADALRARLDGVASDTVREAILTAQRRGRAGATLGEVLNRADVLVFWGTDPAARYPRYLSRYAVEPRGMFTPEGRRSRTIVAVDVGAARGPADADLRVAVEPAKEADALALLSAAIRGNLTSDADKEHAALFALADRLRQARYAVLVNDGEPDASAASEPARAEGLIALTQALNGPTRAALSTLRAGGNRSGAEAVMLWQTGFPLAVDFSRGYPRYRAEESASEVVARGAVTLTLVVGSAAGVPEPFRVALSGIAAPATTIVIGPRASEAPFPVHAAIDTGVAGIHEGGTAYRMDDVPLPLRPALTGPATAVEVLRAVAGRIARPVGAVR
jgi:formylmethanofuran dehydrogenase subunit B